MGATTYGRSVSWNLTDLDPPRAFLGDREDRKGLEVPDNRPSSDLSITPLPSLKPLSKYASDSIYNPTDPPTQNAVVQVEKGDIKTKIQKRLSFGDTLDLSTNIYTPADDSDIDKAAGLDSGVIAAVNGSSTSLERRWTNDDEGGPRLFRRKSQDTQSQYSYYMDKDARYYFQHPWVRLFVAYFVIFFNFLLFAEDPVSHSHTESNIPVVGNVFSFVANKYPDEWYWKTIKIIMWIIAMLCGMLVGKVLIHGLLFKRMIRLKMFRDDEGSWMIMSLTVIVSLYMFSYVYNLILLIFKSDYQRWQVGSAMGVTNESMMKAAATCTWLGDLVTALMVTDMMLQDNLYPHWATSFRRLYKLSNVPRILIFWCGSIVVATIVIFLIVSDYISWDDLNKGFIETNELSRAFIASSILVMDLIIVMQDWDYPHFTQTIDVNLPGFSTHTLHWKYGKVSVTGKWFNYGIIFLVMIFDLNMWKNQIFYKPENYGQYIHPETMQVYTVEDESVLEQGNSSFWTWEARKPYHKDEMFMYSRYVGFSMGIKCMAFIPNIIAFILLFYTVSTYGRFPPNQDGTYGGRLKIKRSSWRERRTAPSSNSHHHHYRTVSSNETHHRQHYRNVSNSSSEGCSGNVSKFSIASGTGRIVHDPAVATTKSKVAKENSTTHL